MKCTRCDMIVPDQDRFCDYCGTDLHPERARRTDNPFQQYKRRQVAEKREEERQRAQARKKRRTEPAPRAADVRKAGQVPKRRRARTKMLPPRYMAKVVRAATKSRKIYRVPDSARKPLAVLCGVVVVFVAVGYTWNYTVGYSSPHQLVLDFDRMIRAGEYSKANGLASDGFPGELMGVISRASLSETYPYHLLRLDEGTRRIKYDDFTIDLQRSMGKWTLTVRKP